MKPRRTFREQSPGSAPALLPRESQPASDAVKLFWHVHGGAMQAAVQAAQHALEAVVRVMAHMDGLPVEGPGGWQWEADRQQWSRRRGD